MERRALIGGHACMHVRSLPSIMGLSHHCAAAVVVCNVTASRQPISRGRLVAAWAEGLAGRTVPLARIHPTAFALTRLNGEVADRLMAAAQGALAACYESAPAAPSPTVVDGRRGDASPTPAGDAAPAMGALALAVRRVVGGASRAALPAHRGVGGGSRSGRWTRHSPPCLDHDWAAARTVGKGRGTGTITLG